MSGFPPDSIKSIRHVYRYLTNWVQDGVVTMMNKTLIEPVISSPVVTNGQETLDFGTGHTDITLSASQAKVSTLVCTGTVDETGAAIIAPALVGKRYVVVNGTLQALTIKKTGGSGVTIATNKTAMVEYIGSDYVRLTADS